MKHNLGVWSGSELQRVHDMRVDDTSFVEIYKQLLQLVRPHNSVECHLSGVRVRPQWEPNEDLYKSHDGVVLQEIMIVEKYSWERVNGRDLEWRRWTSNVECEEALAEYTADDNDIGEGPTCIISMMAKAHLSDNSNRIVAKTDLSDNSNAIVSKADLSDESISIVAKTGITGNSIAIVDRARSPSMEKQP